MLEARITVDCVSSYFSTCEIMMVTGMWCPAALTTALATDLSQPLCFGAGGIRNDERSLWLSCHHPDRMLHFENFADRSILLWLQYGPARQQCMKTGE